MDPASGATVGALRWTAHPAPGLRVTADGWGVEAEWWTRDPSALPAMIAHADTEAESRGGWSGVQGSPPWDLQPAAGAWGLFALVVGIGLLRGRRPTAGFRLPHAIPALLQGSVFAIWSMWWPRVADHLPTVLAQLGLAYALDAALSLWRRGTWSLGVAPVPIVLSINLFLWFDPLASALVIGLAMLAKVAWTREGRHVLNPSAVALATTGALCTFIPALGPYTPLFHIMNLPPWLAEWILLVALIPQLRFGIASVSLGALAGFIGSGILGPGPDIARPATLLALALLVTDPATIPRTHRGRLLFGLAYGIGIRVTSIALVAAGQPDDLAKVLPVPLCNALAQRFDTLGERLPAWSARYPNAAFAAAWFALATARLWVEKPLNFEAATHWSYRTALVRDGLPPTCTTAAPVCAAFGVPGRTGVRPPESGEGPPVPLKGRD